jgi:hypothetical protein
MLDPKDQTKLQGITLERILTELVEYYGWADLGERIRIRVSPATRASRRASSSCERPRGRGRKWRACTSLCSREQARQGRTE